MPLIIYAVLAFVIIGLLLTWMILFAKAKLISSGFCKIFINKKNDLVKEVACGQTLLSALTSQSIAIPCPCGGKATCKQCRLQVIEGGEEPLETDKASFSPLELKAGWRLSCQCKVRGDMLIKLPLHLLEVKKFKGKVMSNNNVATFIKELIVQIPENMIKYQPGDYLQFHVPKFKTSTVAWKASMDPKFYPDWDRYHLFNQVIDYMDLEEEVIRAYSMASYPDEGATLRFNVRIATPPLVGDHVEKNIPWGICSSYMFSLKPGDEVMLSGPFGESHMIHDDRELVFLIGGAGSSFGRSHILDLFFRNKTKRQVALWYGARSLKENIYEEVFRKLEKEAPNFSYHLVLSEPLAEDLQKGWPKEDATRTGFVFKAFELGQLKKMKSPEGCLYYVCGPPLHNKSVMKLLEDYGVPRENIVLDDFGN